MRGSDSKPKRENFLMSEQSRRRPLFVTLFGYLLLVGAVLDLAAWVDVFKGVPLDSTVLGLTAPQPLPTLEFALRFAAKIVAGVGLLKLREWGRLVAMGLVVYEAVSFVNVMLITGGPGVGGVTSRAVFAGEAEAGAVMTWAITVIVGVGVYVAIALYLGRMREKFNGAAARDGGSGGAE